MRWLWSDFFVGLGLGVSGTVWVMLTIRSFPREVPTRHRPDVALGIPTD
jgi:hypothetical protein